MADFTAGERDQPLLQVGGYPVGVSICFEAAFGSLIRRALPEAAYLVNVSNDGWFGDTIAPAQHLQIARLRAIENRRWLARATNTGITALVNPQGQIVRQIPQFQAAILDGELIPMQGATPYARAGDGPVLVMLLLLGGLAVGVSQRSNRIKR
jgi:apolipoprotein N-acyltransferase